MLIFAHRLAQDLGIVDVDDVLALPNHKFMWWVAFYGLERKERERQEAKQQLADLVSSSHGQGMSLKGRAFPKDLE